MIFLLRHASYGGGGRDPGLSDSGKKESLELAGKIKACLNEATEITIWSSTANRARETAEIIQQEMQLAELVLIEKLWSDNWHQEDFDWLKKELDEFDGGVLIIISHLEYVREFPAKIGFGLNGAGYAEGVKIENGKCVMFG